ncbi:MAG TPA: hypothetical protein VIV63_14835, partial [Steroidobacteraceae bacterium]
MKYGHFLLALGTLALANAASAANRPAGYTTICNENKTCSVAASTNVAFGRADQFLNKTLSGTFVCSSATFGGRIAGGVNECSVPTGSAPPPPPPPPTNPPPGGTADLGYYPGCAMPTNTQVVQLAATQVVPAGTVFDGQNKVYNLTGGSQSEGQPAVFDV